MKTNTPRSSSFPHRCLPLLAMGLAILSLTPIHAATVTWDAGGASPTSPVSGAGTWDTTSAYWSNGTTDSAWASGNIAAFGGSSAYTVTLSGVMTIGGLISNNTYTGTGGVTISSGTLNLATAASTTFNLTQASAYVTINSVIAGNSGLTLSGPGYLLINTAATYTGTTTISGGQLRIGVDNALPTSTAVKFTTTSSLLLQSHNLTISSLAGTAVNGNVRNTSNGASVLTINGASSTVFKGQLNDNSTTASLAVKLGGSGTLNLTNTSGLTYHGSTTVTDTATLYLSAGANLVNTSSVTVSGGTLLSDAGNINLGVGGLTLSSGTLTPGGSGVAGSFTLAANQNFTATGGALDLSLDSLGSYDQIIGSGSGKFSLSGVVINIDSGYSYGSYDVFSGFTGSNTVNNITFTGLLNGDTAALGTDGILEISAVPEPGTWGMMMGGAGMLLGMQRLRRRFNG